MRSCYFSLDKLPHRSECEKLLRDYKVGKQIGKGAYGKVFDVCKDTNCNFVLKTMEFSKSNYDIIGSPKLSYENKYKEWKKEIENHLKVIECQKSYKLRFVPDVYDAWYCNDKDSGDSVFYIIMERFDGDLKYFIKIFSNDNNKHVKKLLKSFILIKLKDLREALDHINNSCKICLDDIKLENILYKEYSNGTYDLVFSDFGTSSFGKNITQRCIETDIMRFNQSVEEFREKF